ncbi:MAG TPA: FtsX-like permease family protein [Mycobacteriales bacterium]|nr:FtsX-like permease family protein [Mycobacteriales bacterium]
MPSIRYVGNELRRRRTRTVLTAFGLASGVGLVMGIVGVSDGLDEAQAKVLSPLSSVGTDILVTRTVGATTSTASASPSPSATPGVTREGPGFFAAGGPPGARGGNALESLNDSDATALLNDNSSVITDLSKLGKAGTRFTHDFFLSGTMLTFPSAALDTIKAIDGVASATSALTLQAQHQTGTVPEIVAEVKTGGETLTTTARPAEMTSAEQTAFRSCIQRNGGFGGPVNQSSGPAPAPSPGSGGEVRRVEIGGFGAVNKCLPKRFQEYEAKVVTPLRTIQQLVNPPQTDTATTSWTAAGVDPKSPGSGLITKQNISSGTWFTGAANEVVLSTTYAGKQKLAVGGTLTVNGKAYKVVGLADPTLTGNTADVYFPLSTLQDVATRTGRVNEVLVKVADSSQTDEVAAAIKKALPGAQVVTSKDIADTVTGSLHDAQQLANRLGGALTVIVLISTFAVAVLLTLSSVQKRVREIGTLRALGWTKRRVVGQVLTETALIGVLAGVVGIAAGYAVSVAVGLLSPDLSATSSGVAAGASQVGELFGQTTTSLTRSVSLSAPIHLSTIALGMACALLGALLAGAVGGWRAARLSPAVALRDLG